MVDDNDGDYPATQRVYSKGEGVHSGCDCPEEAGAARWSMTIPDRSKYADFSAFAQPIHSWQPYRLAMAPLPDLNTTNPISP